MILTLNYTSSETYESSPKELSERFNFGFPLTLSPLPQTPISMLSHSLSTYRPLLLDAPREWHEVLKFDTDSRRAEHIIFLSSLRKRGCVTAYKYGSTHAAIFAIIAGTIDVRGEMLSLKPKIPNKATIQ